MRGKKGIPAKIRKGQTLRKGYSWTRMDRVGSKPTLADWNRQEILVYRNQVQAPFYKARHCMRIENPQLMLKCTRVSFRSIENNQAVVNLFYFMKKNLLNIADIFRGTIVYSQK